jgi:tyrosinase
MGIRKNQSAMTTPEWARFIAAIDAMHGTDAAPPAYRRFVSLHVDAMSMAGMDWAVHTMNMPGMHVRGRNFLAWHRRLLKLFEDRPQAADPNGTVTVPYWDSVTDREIPPALNDPALLARWSVTRKWNPSKLAHPADLNAVKIYSGTFIGFQALLEGVVHNDTHRAVGGSMDSAGSPTDPLFWLHHAFIDKIWSDWQASPNGEDPPNTSEVLQPADMQPSVPFGVPVSSQLSIDALGYSYA